MPKRTGDLTPAERALRSQLGTIGAHARWKRDDPVEGTKAARAAGPGQLPYWERNVDPDNALPAAERRRRAEHAKAEYYKRLQLASARARRNRALPRDAA